MVYPSKLLPSVFFRPIDPNNLIHLNIYLIRHSPTGDNFLNGQIINKCICDPLSHVADLSLNFSGKYDKSHTTIEIKEQKNYFYSDWTFFQKARRPLPGQFIENRQRGLFYVPMRKLHLHQVPSEKALTLDFRVICEIVHKPVRCNFWHVQLQWKDETGKIFSKEGKKLPRAVQTSSRSMIKAYATPVAIGQEEIPFFYYFVFFAERLQRIINRLFYGKHYSI